MIIEVTYCTGDKKVFIVDENILVIDLCRLLTQYGGSVKSMEII